MTAGRRWLVWVSLLAGTVVACVLVGRTDQALVSEPTRSAEATRNMAAKARARGIARPGMPGENIPPSTPTLRRPVSEVSGINPFAVKSWQASSTPEEPVEQIAEPGVPPLPYRYSGILEDDKGNRLVQVERAGQSLVIVEGEVIDDVYRFEAIQDAQLMFTYLPLGVEQVLPLPADFATEN